MKIGFIGAGKVGSAFGHFLKDKKVDVIGYYSRSRASSRRAGDFTGTKILEFDELVLNSDFIFITTPDDVISKIWDKLKAYNLQDKKIFHMSGAISSTIFKGIEEKNAYGYSLHPLFPFSDVNNYEGLNDAIFTIEGKNIAIIEDFLCMSKIKYFEIDSTNKPKYHAASVFSSNYMVALANISKKLLLECGIPEANIEEALFPLMNNNLLNIRDQGVENALTGPITRGDTATIKKHQEVIGEYEHIYNELGRVALDITKARGKLSETEMNELKKILGGISYEKDSSKF